MAISSYLVIPERGATTQVCTRLAELPGCEVVPASNRDALILVLEAEGRDAERALRERVEATEGIEALFLTFGEIAS